MISASDRPAPQEPEIRCRDGCGATVAAKDIEGSGWQMLPIQNRYRCVDCWRALRNINEKKNAG